MKHIPKTEQSARECAVVFVDSPHKPITTAESLSLK